MTLIRSVCVYLWLAAVLVINLPRRKRLDHLTETDFDTAKSKMWAFAQKVADRGSRILGVTYEVEGVENVPMDGSVVFVGNHLSMFDAPLMLAAIPRPSGFIVKEELGKVPVFRGWVKTLGCFFLPRGESRKSLEIIIAAAKLLKKQDFGMVIFPEGTRSHDGNLGVFKPGSLKIATRSGATIVPFAIENTDEVMPRDTLRIKALPVKVTFLPPITAEDAKGKDTATLTRGIMADIAAVIGSPLPEEEAATEDAQN